MRVAIASFSGMPPEFTDNDLLMERLAAAGLVAETYPWDDADASWRSFDLVVARSPWDYTFRLKQFYAWTELVDGLVENSAAIIRWNSDKTYLGDLGTDGIPVVETIYVRPGDPVPPIAGQVVVKPTVSAGARDTGRFGPGSAPQGERLITTIQAAGKTAMVQPFLESVESAGETAVVMFDGQVSHVLRKRAVLEADEVAPIRDDELQAAEAMYHPELVVAGTAEPDEIELAHSVIEAVAARLGAVPLCARVDMLRAADGSPVLLELEAIEPNLYFGHAPDPVVAADQLVAAIERRAVRA